MTKQEFLAFSLPYGLKVNLFESGNSYGIHSIYQSEDYMQEFERKSVYSFRPILHPLTDLTKEIEHNGEKFVPIERVEESFIEGTEDLLVLSLEAIDYFIENEDFSRIEYLPAILIRKLIEWHFDIASLIEKGEAIDVNTLPENPYK